MRASYDDSLLSALAASSKEEEVFGSPIFIKPIPDDSRSGVIDPREFELAKRTLEARKAMPQTLQNLREETGFPNLNLNTAEIITKVFPIEGDGLPFDLWMYVPRKPFGKKNRKAVIYAHGGSYIAGSVYGEENPMKYLAEIADCPVFNVDYSLAPEYPFPTQLNQVEEAIRYVIAHAEELGIDPNQIYLSGDSAGANLALSVCQRFPKGTISGLILWYPVVSLSLETLPFAWRESDYEMQEAYKPYIIPRLILGRSDANIGPLVKLISSFYLRNGEKRDDPRISPLYYRGDSFPKMILFTAEYDGLRLQGEYFAAKVNKEGGACRCYRYRGLHHGFIDKFGYFPQAEDSVKLAAKFMEE